jgi:flagellar biosynthesis/type III secretory pathway M-ring protein FliF/YscJ
MDLLNRTFLHLYELFRSMTPAGRLTASLSVLVVLISLGYLSSYRMAESEVDLMHGVTLASSERTAMQAALARANLTGYKIREHAIYVPRSQEAAYMAALADGNALPRNLGAALREAASGGSPFEIGSQRDQRWKIAKQELLAQAIREMFKAESAYVDYDVDNKPGNFQGKVITATALVKLGDSEQLDGAAVASIRKLVAGAIAGMKPENIAVADLNGRRTWSGNSVEGAAGDSVRLSLQRMYERELKGKILGALRYIPNVTVEASVGLDRQRACEPNDEREKETACLVPTVARVSVGVPMSYFQKVWHARNPAGPSSVALTADQAALDQIRAAESANIQQHVAQLLPSAESSAHAAELVRVTTFQDLPQQEPSSADFGRDALARAIQWWRPLGISALGLTALLALHSLLRRRPRVASSPTTAERLRGDDDAAVGKENVVPVPHVRRFHNPAHSPRDDLSELVENDPDAAAGILRSWIGQLE